VSLEGIKTAHAKAAETRAKVDEAHARAAESERSTEEQLQHRLAALEARVGAMVSSWSRSDVAGA